MDLALQYIDIVFGKEDIDRLTNLLADQFSFQGPFFKFDSAADYINSLKADPPEGFGYTMISTFEDETSACLVYKFSKPGIDTPMAQLFETDNGKISKILLVFDSAPFLQNTDKT